MNPAKDRVLLIDRHAEWISFAVGALTRQGYEVAQASDFDRALECCIDEAFDLILVGLDQAETHLAGLSQLASRPRRIVVMFPVRQTHERLRVLFKAGVYDTIDKPYRADDLVEMVSEQLGEARRRSHRSPRIHRTRERRALLKGTT